MLPRKSTKPPLSETHPELAAQWHPTKNGDVTPDEVIAGNGGEGADTEDGDADPGNSGENNDAPEVPPGQAA